jgi:hypothetical protein
MTLMVNLDPAAEEWISRRAQETGAEPETVAALLIQDAQRNWAAEEELSEAELADIRAAVARADADVAAGRVKPLSEVIADKAARFGITPPDGSEFPSNG